MKNQIEKIILLILLILVSTGYYTHTLPVLDILYIGIYTNIYLVFKSRKFKPLAFMFLFWLSFILNLIPYYRDGIDISGGRFQFDIPSLYDQTMFNQVFMLLCVALFFPRIRERVYLKDHFVYSRNMFGYWVTLSFMVLILFFGQTGQNVFSAGGYGKGASQSSTINEYFMIMLPVALIFSGNSTILKRVVYCVVVLYLLKDISYGGRNGTLQNGLLLFLIFDNPRIKYWQVILLGSVPVYLLLVFGAVRADPMVLFSSSTSEILMLPFRNENSFLMSLETQNDVFYASVRFLGLVDFGVLQQSDRLKIFFYNILALVLPYKYLPPEASLGAFELIRFNAGGGGLLSAYFYFFLGLPGLVFIAWYICFIIRKTIRTTNMYFLVYALVFFASYPRWLAYTPIVMFKLCSYGVLFFVVMKLANNIFRISVQRNSSLFKLQGKP